MGEKDVIKIPIEIIEEIKAGNKSDDPLYKWIRDKDNLDMLLLKDVLDPDRLRRVVALGYANDLTDDELEQIGRDPFLVSYAIDRSDRCVVTNEMSRPSKKRQNRKIPDVCQILGVQCCTLFHLNNVLDFRTNWRD